MVYTYKYVYILTYVDNLYTFLIYNFRLAIGFLFPAVVIILQVKKYIYMYIYMK